MVLDVNIENIKWDNCIINNYTEFYGKNSRSILIRLMLKLFLRYKSSTNWRYSSKESVYLLGNTLAVLSPMYYDMEYKRGIPLIKNILVNSQIFLCITLSTSRTCCVGMNRISLGIDNIFYPLIVAKSGLKIYSAIL